MTNRSLRPPSRDWCLRDPGATARTKPNVGGQNRQQAIAFAQRHGLEVNADGFVGLAHGGGDRIRALA
jgi:hypothetical protein